MRTILVFLLVLGSYGALFVLFVLYAFYKFDTNRALRAAGLLSPFVAATTTALAFYFRERR